MPTSPSAGHPSTPGPRAVAGLVLATVLAGCTGGPSASGQGPTEPPVTAPPPPTASVPTASVAAPSVVAPTAAATPDRPWPTPTAPTPTTPPEATETVAIPSRPPTALLVPATANAEAVPGALGSYTWQDAGSDAPWIIVRARDAAVDAAGPYRIDLGPALAPGSWTVSWAPIVNGRRGAIAGYAQGQGPVVDVAGPPGAGPWTLRLEAEFGPGRRAAWYWRLSPSG